MCPVPVAIFPAGQLLSTIIRRCVSSSRCVCFRWTVTYHNHKQMCSVSHSPQSSGEVLPVPAVVVPFGQLVHGKKPILSLYVPWGQGIQGKPYVVIILLRSLNASAAYPGIHAERDMQCIRIGFLLYKKGTHGFEKKKVMCSQPSVI